MSEELDLKGLAKELGPEIRDLVTDVLKDTGKEAKKYATEIAKDFARNLYASVVEDDQVVQRNIEHLKAQVKLLAVRSELQIHNRLVERVEFVLERAFKIAVKALIAL